MLPFGLPEIDEALPWRGLPLLAALHEIENAGGADEDGAAVTFLSASRRWLARLASYGGRPVLWCLQFRSPRSRPGACRARCKAVGAAAGAE